jgi:AcrR family transcriptional regulator
LGKVRKARIPSQKRGVETKAKLVEAAKVLFIEKGYYKTHGPEIAARAGLATGTFYSYFNDKKDVLFELLRQFYQQPIDRALSIADRNFLISGDGRKIIHQVIQTLYTVHAEQQEFHMAIYPLMFMDENIMELTRQENQKVIDIVASYLRENNLVCITDVETAAELIFRASDEIIHRLLFWGAQSNSERLIAELEEMLFKYLFTPSKSPVP